MACINSKKDVNALVDKFYQLEPIKKANIKIVFKLTWWSAFNKRRVIFFMQRVVDGMDTNIAFNKANSMDKSELSLILKILNWNESHEA